MKQEVKDNIKVKGRVTLRSYKAGTKELLGTIVQENLIMQGTYTGLNQLVKRLIADNTYSANINYGAIGTGTTAPAITDTQLETEVARVIFSTAVATTILEATFQFYFPDANLANGTYNEFGMFVDGTASANTGKIFNRALFTSPYAKVAGTDTTVQVDVDFS